MTNKIVLRSLKEFMTGYKPAYTPIMPMFLEGAKQYPVEVGKVDFERAETVGDLRARLFTPKDTEIHQIHSKEGSKTYKKYCLAAQYVQSGLQDTRGYEDVVAQVLDEHNRQSDQLFLTGDGTSNATVKNNGLFYSSDPNYTSKTSATIAKDSAGNHFASLYEKMMSILEDANNIDGQKMVLIYGSTMAAKFNGLMPATEQAFSKVFGDATEGVSKRRLPNSIIPTGLDGFIVVNTQQVKLHYMTLPKIDDQGVNNEKKYAWTNFLMGSSMLEVLAQDGVIHQPLTFAP